MNVVDVVNLQKTYNDGTHAVQGVDLTVKSGEVLALLGPNGAGKSTTINCMIGRITASSGTISILGYDIRTDYNKIRDQLGYVPQELIFYPHLSVIENLDLFAACYEIEDQTGQVSSMMELLELSEFANRRAESLSGGQKRRLNLAIGLLNNPQLLLLDEPSAGMDPQSRNQLWQSITSIAAKGIAIILTTHLMEVADLLSDRIAIIDHGEIIACGTSSELKATYGGGRSLLIHLEKNPDPSLLDELRAAGLDNFEVIDNKISIQATTDLSLFSDIVEIIQRSSHIIREIRMRESTLEDVFISLTGSTLREEI